MKALSNVSELNHLLRRYLTWQHRWTGLLMAAFLIVVGLTGSILALKPQINRMVHPELFAKPVPGHARLSLGELATKAEQLFPHAGVWFVTDHPDQANVQMSAKTDNAKGKPYPIDFASIDLDPWTGNLLGKERLGCMEEVHENFMSFVFKLHTSLALGSPGKAILYYVALAWTLDCFVGFYLTFPTGLTGFWKRWLIAWKVKPRSGAYRLNYDLHRAGGLWVWPLLFIFAWSSVNFVGSPVYGKVMNALSSPNADDIFMSSLRPKPSCGRSLDWRAAQARGDELMNSAAHAHRFTIKRPVMLAYMTGVGYAYTVQTSDDVRCETADSTLWIDGDNGRLIHEFRARPPQLGAASTKVLTAMHLGDFLGEPYRYVEAAVGLMTAIISVTGIYIWWKKRSAKIRARKKRSVAAISATT